MDRGKHINKAMLPILQMYVFPNSYKAVSRFRVYSEKYSVFLLQSQRDKTPKSRRKIGKS